MSFWIRIFFAAWLGVVLSGCAPSSQDEEQEPHFVLGQSRVNAMDYQGAIEAFEESLEVNPHSAAAHYQLAMLYENKESDPAAAIYHYQQYLKFDPRAENADIIRQHITSCKQQLAADVLPLPSAPAATAQLEKLVEQNRQLQQQVDSLQKTLDQWNAWYANQTTAAKTNSVMSQNDFVSQPDQNPVQPVQPTQIFSTQPVVANTTHSENSAKQNSRSKTHTVATGETAMAICRKFGIKLTELEAANPGMNPSRIRAGQVLNIP